MMGHLTVALPSSPRGSLAPPAGLWWLGTTVVWRRNPEDYDEALAARQASGEVGFEPKKPNRAGGAEDLPGVVLGAEFPLHWRGPALKTFAGVKPHPL